MTTADQAQLMTWGVLSLCHEQSGQELAQCVREVTDTPQQSPEVPGDSSVESIRLSVIASSTATGASTSSL